MIMSQNHLEDTMSRYVSPVIPVLDLMIGQVVWAKGGRRGSYAPVHSALTHSCLLYTSPSPRDRQKSRMPSSA